MCLPLRLYGIISHINARRKGHNISFGCWLCGGLLFRGQYQVRRRLLIAFRSCSSSEW